MFQTARRRGTVTYACINQSKSIVGSSRNHLNDEPCTFHIYSPLAETANSGCHCPLNTPENRCLAPYIARLLSTRQFPTASDLQDYDLSLRVFGHSSGKGGPIARYAKSIRVHNNLARRIRPNGARCVGSTCSRFPLSPLRPVHLVRR